MITVITGIIALCVVVWAVWFVIETVCYIATGEYEIDKRLDDIGDY